MKKGSVVWAEEVGHGGDGWVGRGVWAETGIEQEWVWEIERGCIRVVGDCCALPEGAMAMR